MKKFAALFLAMIMVLSLVACGGGKTEAPAKTDEPAKTDAPATEEVKFDGVIKFGAVGPLTGASAESGIACKQGQELAVAEWNAKGGIEIDGKHYEIELLYEDSAGAPETAVAAAEKLLGVDKVDVIFAETLISSCILAVMDLAPKYPDVVFTTCEGVSTGIPQKFATDPDKYYNFFKACWSSDVYGTITADSINYLTENGMAPVENNKTVAFVLEDTDYGRSNCDAAISELEKLGWTSVAYEVSPQGQTDFYSVINKLMTLDPDVVVTCFVPVASGISWVKQVQELGAEWTDIAIVYPTKPGFYEDSGSACADLFFIPITYDAASPTLIEFSEKIEAMHKVPFAVNQMSGYDVTNMMCEAIEKAGTLSASEGLAETYGASEYSGVQGTYVFDENHCAKGGVGFLNLATAQIQPDAATYLVIYPDGEMKTGEGYAQY